jgi:hypothetical protein
LHVIPLIPFSLLLFLKFNRLRVMRDNLLVLVKIVETTGLAAYAILGVPT